MWHGACMNCASKVDDSPLFVASLPRCRQALDSAIPSVKPEVLVVMALNEEQTFAFVDAVWERSHHL
eukprot:4504843-Prorocentrum_lima.AAC.1